MNPKIPKFRDSPIEPSKFTDNPNEITGGALNEGTVSKLKKNTTIKATLAVELGTALN